MQPLVESAAAVVDRLGRSAVPLSELVRLLRDSGLAVSESVLLRSLAAEPERFRVIEPWRALRGAAGVGQDPWSAPAWVVPARRPVPGEANGQERPALGRLHSTLVGLGWQLDPTSASDVARWFGMVIEAERFSAALPPEDRLAPPGSVRRSDGRAASATPRPRPLLPSRAPTPSRPLAGRPPLLRGSR